MNPHSAIAAAMTMTFMKISANSKLEDALFKMAK